MKPCIRGVLQGELKAVIAVLNDGARVLADARLYGCADLTPVEVEEASRDLARLGLKAIQALAALNSPSPRQAAEVPEAAE